MSVSQRSDDAVCRDVLRRSGSNFALPLQLLPAEKRRGSIALYAFCRIADDLVDEAPSTEEAVEKLDLFFEQLKQSLAGRAVQEPVVRALAAAAGRFAIPPEHLFAILDGVRRDLLPVRYHTVSELIGYCRLVASAVGMAAVSIWGVRPGVSRTEWMAAADACGLAFQWTNILRDIIQDRDRGRVYLPVESFIDAGCTVEQLIDGEIGQSFSKLAFQETARANGWFTQASDLDRMLSLDGRRVFRAMFGVYRELFYAVERAGPEIFQRRVCPPQWRRVAAGLATVYGGPS